MFIDLLKIVFVLVTVTKMVRSARQVTVHCSTESEDTAVSRIELKTNQLKYQADQNRHVLARIESRINGMGGICASHHHGTIVHGTTVHGTTVHGPASSCDELHHDGHTRDGTYYLFVSGLRIRVYCQFDKKGHNYLVFQRRKTGNQDFYKTWAEYKAGFGNPAGDYWLGLENIHIITKSRAHELYIEMEDWEGNVAVAAYRTFWIEGESSNYKLRVSGYTGTAGDSLSYHNSRPFSTKDHDNDVTIAGSCAVQYHGGWWYVGCHHSNLNGFYYRGGQYTPRGVSWKSWKNKHYSLKKVEMKMRPTNIVSIHSYPYLHVHPNPTSHYHTYVHPHVYAHPHLYPSPTPTYGPHVDHQHYYPNNHIHHW